MLSSEGLQALCRARARLLAGGDEPLRIRRLAAESGLSPYHFIRRFKAVFGETPHQVRIRSRLERAKELLLCSEESVTEISLRLGFSSLGTFSARFARQVGMPPSRFRRTAARLGPEAVSCLGLMAGEPG
ncbi:MAG TPA: helix-turn-helix transcriptional regulator [Myxococcaceae bacterium]|nr:helix-turn-helix transcriptional regulator [Myxococcaceae bacterium]